MLDNSETPLDLRGELQALYSEASEFLHLMDTQVPRVRSLNFGQSISSFWNSDDQSRAAEFAQRIRQAMARVADVIARAPLMEDIDRQRLRTSTKQMEAAVTGWSYEFWDKYYEEGYGFRPQREQLTYCFSAQQALGKLTSAYRSIIGLLDMVGYGAAISRNERVSVRTTPAYNPNTAFLMMWIDKTLDDVVDTVRETFGNFGVAAQRADDIEHEGAITPHILNEIERSEFLFADLTGARPNVYYEIGYAHALGKRVILFRRSGTPIHFDLAGHNCPEYDSMRDLRTKLRKRLESMTGRSGSEQ